MNRDQWWKKLLEIKKSRAGCECKKSPKCTATWIRCNGVLKAQAAAREKLGPEPKA